MGNRFAGKVALVTGGGAGIGRAVAQDLAAQGAAVVVSGRNREPLEEAVAAIERAGGDAYAVVADISRPEQAAGLVEATLIRYGALHVAVNNAGLRAAGGAVGDFDEAEFAYVLAVNVTGTRLSMRYEIEHMRAAGGGAIVNLSSTIGAHMAVPGLGAYAASKAAINALTRTAALECIRDGVRVNAVSPGPVDTAMSLLPGETAMARDERLKTQIPIGRVATTAEVSAAVLWLASDEAGYVVGHDLVLDGGASL